MNTHKVPTTLIVGAGNPYRGDDGVGIAIIRKLQEMQRASKKNDGDVVPIISSINHQNFVTELSRLDLLDIGTDGLSLLDLLPNYHQVIIIDAVNMGATSGTVRLFTPQEAKINITNDALSTHGFGLAEMLHLAEQLSLTSQTDIKIIGVQPKSVAFGAELSHEIQQVIPQIITIILERLQCH